MSDMIEEDLVRVVHKKNYFSSYHRSYISESPAPIKWDDSVVDNSYLSHHLLVHA